MHTQAHRHSELSVLSHYVELYVTAYVASHSAEWPLALLYVELLKFGSPAAIAETSPFPLWALASGLR